MSFTRKHHGCINQSIPRVLHPPAPHLHHPYTRPPLKQPRRCVCALPPHKLSLCVHYPSPSPCQPSQSPPSHPPRQAGTQHSAAAPSGVHPICET
ncbi:hypothetical protein E2C01_073708 [Portunus trituberculatus]|uniref:Uncharacterized protein n=1 Tax=Portunus trituberculatus TaxID=210409 RepID=A0A5B7IEL4_PORTR|nr:hypothetical protein [Portunus trituberculatus]